MKQFDAFLRELVFTKTSRNDLMTKLQLKYEIFSNLDAITLSRWSNGVTSPSLEKQLIIAKEENLTDEFLATYSIYNASVKSKKQVESFWNSMDSSFHSIMFYDDEKRFEFKELNYTQCEQRYVIYKKLKKAFNATPVHQGKDFVMQTFNLVSNGSQQVASHSSLYTDLYNSLSNFDISPSTYASIENALPLEDYVVNGVSMYSSSEDNKIIMGLVANYLLEKYFHKKLLLTILRGTTIANTHEMIGGRQICCLKHSPKHENLYLYSIPLTEFLGNPIMFQLMQDQRKFFNSLSLT